MGVFREFFAAMRLACEMPRRAAIVSVVVALKAAPQRAFVNVGLARPYTWVNFMFTARKRRKR